MATALTAAGLKASDLSAVAVTIGPGTFTGVRIGLAAARGLRLACGIPLTGVTTLELMAHTAARRWPDRPVMAALDARRDQVYAQYFRRGDGPYAEAWSAPAALSAAGAAAMLNPGSVIVGSGAALIAGHLETPSTMTVAEVWPDAADMIGLVSERPLTGANAPAPKPVYLRAPDAVPARPILNL